jgi:hypothetical protein
MLDIEEKILEATNEVGRIATEEGLKQYDTHGGPILVDKTKYTSRCQTNKVYQSPYGPISIKRHVYQTSRGGSIYCPLEVSARIIHNATPRYAKMLSNKYSKMCAPEVLEDMQSNHGRGSSLRYIQDVSQAVSSIAQLKEEAWSYKVPELDEEIKTVNISLDGAYVAMKKEGYREAMVGSISLYDKEGNRVHSIYLGEVPEYGKAKFKNRLSEEIKHVKQLYPRARYIGIADGAKSNWTFLAQHTKNQIIDFYHVSEYLSQVANAMYPLKREAKDKVRWLEERCHQLKHEKGAATMILEEIQTHLENCKKLKKQDKEALKGVETFFINNKKMMNYYQHVKKKWPIGSGVTEAACKTLIKQRFCQSGMRWKSAGMKIVLSLRQLVQTKDRWRQFWKKIDQYGIGCAA